MRIRLLEPHAVAGFGTPDGLGLPSGQSRRSTPLAHPRQGTSFLSGAQFQRAGMRLVLRSRPGRTKRCIPGAHIAPGLTAFLMALRRLTAGLTYLFLGGEALEPPPLYPGYFVTAGEQI